MEPTSSEQADSPPLEDLLLGVARGEELALHDFYEITKRRVFGLALRIVGDREAAEEATLDAYSQVWRKASDYDPARGSAIAWLLTIARARSIDKVRSLRRFAGSEDLADYTEILRDAGPDPRDAAAGSERAQAVRHALAELPADQRNAICAAFFGGYSHSRIAEVSSAPLGTVKSRIRTGLARLRDLLQTPEEGLA